MLKIRRMQSEEEQTILGLVAGLSDWFDKDARTRAIPVDIKHHTTFVADNSGDIVGFISLHVFGGRLNISWMGVRNDWQSKGIGTMLLQRADELARKLNLDELGVFTLGDTVDYPPYDLTRSFYLKKGFEVYQRNQTDNPGCPEEWCLKKRIKDTRF